MGLQWRMCLLCWLTGVIAGGSLHAQQVQFPGTSSGVINPPAFNTPGAQLSPPAFGQPNFTQLAPGYGQPGFGQPVQPGYAQPGFGQPAYAPPASGGGLFGNTSNPFASWFNPQPAAQGFSSPGTPAGAPYVGAPGSGFGAQPYVGNAPPGFAQPQGSVFGPPPVGSYPGTYPNPYQQPYVAPGSNTLFPNGLWGPNAANGTFVDRFRYLQHPRLSDTYIYGADRPEDLQTHDIEVAVTGALPNFLLSSQPLYITPTYVHHLWDGPHSLPADLPENAYSAFLDFFWSSDPCRPLGLELGVAVGAFSDFNTFNEDSIRVLGEGFGVVRLTPELTFKLGVWYLNRNDLKLLPAGGLVWQPNPQLKLDILFPNPKLSRYLTTLPNGDVWGYVSAEYGGGAWTIVRTDGVRDRVDINDIRVKVGLDWVNQRGWKGYVEVGYVFDRQVVYVVDPSDSFSPRDAFMAGAGFSF